MTRAKRMALLCVLIQLLLVCIVSAQGPMAPSSQPAPGQPAPEPQNPLVGKPAPAFRLDLLNGGTLDLAAFKDKNVVLLDFWATWCPPCRMSMPIVERVAKRFADKGVQAFAVNLREPTDKVQQFLRNSPLDVTVALDKTGSVGHTYGIEAIPFIVVIDKKGVVRAVYEGIPPTFEKDLAADLAKVTGAPASRPAGR